MVLLAHQSTGSEEADRLIIEDRLCANKKVIVRTVSACQEEARFILGELFGWDSVGDMKLLSEEKLTHQQEWQCALHRNSMKLGDHARERAREGRRTLLVKAEREKGDPLTAKQFAEKLRVAGKTLTLHEFDVTDIPTVLIQEWRKRYADCWTRYGAYSNIKGIVGETVASITLRNRLHEEFSKLEPMEASDLSSEFKNNSLYAVQGEYRDQVLFRSRDGDPKYKNHMELDALYRTVTSQQYVALDVTTNHEKKFHDAERTYKLDAISEALEQEIVLIDIALKNVPFSFEQRTERMYRWSLPCTIDFSHLLSDIIPGEHGWKNPAPPVKTFAKH